MSEELNQLYLIKISNGIYSEVPVTEANFLVGNSGTINFGLGSNIFDVPDAQGNPVASVIGGGQYNSTSGLWGVIDGGLYNSNKSYLGGVIGGGLFNQIRGNYSTLGGGYWNCILSCCLEQDYSYSFIGGGARNKIEGISGQYNSLLANSIIGGERNCIRGSRHSVIGGGLRNCVIGANNLNDLNVVFGGACNFVSGNFSSIINGLMNCVQSDYSSILAGRCVSISKEHSGAAVLTDGQNRTHASCGEHMLTLDFASGINIVTGKLILNNEQIYANQVLLAPSDLNTATISGKFTFDNNHFYFNNGNEWKKIWFNSNINPEVSSDTIIRASGRFI